MTDHWSMGRLFVIYVQSEDISMTHCAPTQLWRQIGLWGFGKTRGGQALILTRERVCVCVSVPSLYVALWSIIFQNGCQRSSSCSTSTTSELILIPGPFTCVTSFHFVLLKMFLMCRFTIWMSNFCVPLGFSEIRRWVWSILDGKVLFILSL